MDYLKQKVVFVNYVSDRKNADIHVIVTEESTTGGGEWRLLFVGREKESGKDQTLTFFSQTTDTFEEKRRRFVNVLSLGLLRYVAETPLADKININYEGKSNDSMAGEKDPWNYWIFRASVYGYISGQQKSNYKYLNGSLGADRITEKWKTSFGSNLSYRKNKYELEDNSSIVNSTISYNHKGLLIKSLGDYWGIGTAITMQRSVFYNLRPSYRAILAVERNLFPYKESSQHVLALTYFTGFTKLNYEEETIFDKLHETRFTQGIRIGFDSKREWGNADFGVQFSHVGKVNNMRATIGGDISWRITKGFSFDPRGRVRFIRDQIYLSKRGLSEQDVILGRHAQRTNLDYFISMGLTFTFGSKYSNVVNKRLDLINSFGEIF